MIRFHKFFSYAFLILSGTHLFLWLVYFGMSGMLSTNIMFGSVPYTYDKRDFTIPAMYYVFVFFLIPIFGILSLNRIRRWKYEIFYYSHMIGAVIVVAMVVWHAKSSWYYVVPPIILYVIDQLMLMWKCTRIAHVLDIQRLNDQRYVEISVSVDEIFKSEIYEAHMDIYNKSLSNKDKKLFVFGQYFWINIPSVSSYEWHPICCVNSSLAKRECTFIIQKKQIKKETLELTQNSSNNNEWCEKVCDLVHSKEKIVNKMMEFKLDGPYGEPIIIDAYRKILIVVGGVGFHLYICNIEKRISRRLGLLHLDQSRFTLELTNYPGTCPLICLDSYAIFPLTVFFAHNPTEQKITAK